jgi:uncharacterized membrane protein YdjX (TVP38/TMEM64 family)
MKNMKRWLPLIVLIALIATAYSLGLHNSLTLDNIQEKKSVFLNYAEAHPFLSAGLFILAYTAATSLSLPVASFLTLLGGFLFGKYLGTVYVVLAATMGATIIFSVARSSVGQTLREKAGSLYQRIEKNMQDNAAGYMLFMRLVPLFPFVLVNIVPALFNVRIFTFAWTTFVGIIPGTFVYVNLGQQLAEISSLSDLVSLQTVLAISLLGVFALVPILYKKLKGKKAALSIIVLCLVTVSAGSNTVHASGEYNKFLDLYDGLLESYVERSEYASIPYNAVDYINWGQDSRHEAALEILTADSANFSDSRAVEISYWINVYNFLTIDLIVRENEMDSIRNLGGFLTSPWTKHEWEIGEQSFTLDYIEHKILRPMDEPRVHFAINCASVSCPDLRQEAYRSSDLDRQLDEQTKLFLDDKHRGYLYDEQSKTLKLSKIFDWFDEDFDKGNVAQWLSAYRSELKDQKVTIGYLKYHWDLNKVRQNK